MEPLNPGEIPLWIKVTYSLFVCLVIPVYWKQYGPGNFLWFSDIALLAIVPALWLENALLPGMMALAVLLLDILWIFDFFLRSITGASLIGLSSYMFDPKIPLITRAVSLFHIVFPVLLLWMIHRLGYDDHALAAQTLVAWIVLPVSYFFTQPSKNINWVHGRGDPPRIPKPAWRQLVWLMIGIPLVIYLPTHLVLKWLFG